MSENFEKLEKLRVPALDEILGVPFKVLKDGFVRVVDYLGTDESIVQAARVSYGKGTKKIREDEALIRYLLRHQHTTPFEMCEIKLHVRVPMDCWRQWIRHRTANVNEYSTRYSIAIDATESTKANEWRGQAITNRQGSEGFLDASIGEELTRQERELHKLTRDVYQKRIDAGVAREQARKDLPLSTYTEAYWKIDLHNLLHFLHLRMELNAQLEIRQYAEVICNEIVKRWCPITWQAFWDYQMNSMTFSGLEIKIITAMLKGEKQKVYDLGKEFNWIKADNSKTSSRELFEFEEKLEKLKIPSPW
ncbi:MAG: FAD-dependent thymidylate synthase [Ignavibacteriaceae bacterium]|nr:FAD-dependent thymidylate synthase [Ignavibacteriaceae bacterium]